MNTREGGVVRRAFAGRTSRTGRKGEGKKRKAGEWSERGKGFHTCNHNSSYRFGHLNASENNKGLEQVECLRRPCWCVSAELSYLTVK